MTYIISPRNYCRALELLGLPSDHRLTVGELWQAAAIEQNQQQNDENGQEAE